MLSNTLSILALGLAVVSATPLPKRPDGQQCLLAGRRGYYRDGLCIDAKLDVDVDVHKRSLVSPFLLGHAYPDRTPCWVQGRRGWVKDQTCTDLVDIDASISIGKRHHSFDDPYFADGTPCFHRGREGVVHDLLCVDLDIDVGDRYPDSDYYGPWSFSHPYSDGRPCWVDNRRGWVHDGSCGNLLDIDADILISKRFYKDDPYYVNGVPCVDNGKEGVMTDYVCIVADVKIDARAYRHGLVNGERCWQRGRQGVVDGLLCVVADVSIGKRGIAAPHDGDACLHDGRWGRYHNDICLDMDIDVDVKARGFLTGGPFGSRNPYTPHQGRPIHPLDFTKHRADKGIKLDADVDINVKRDIKADADADVEIDLHDGHRGWRHGNGKDVDIEADVDVHRRSGHHHHDLVDVDVDADVDVDLHRRALHRFEDEHHHKALEVEADAEVDVDRRSFAPHKHHHDHDHELLDVDADVDVDLHRRALHHFEDEHRHNVLDVEAEAEVNVDRRSFAPHQHDHDLLDVDADIKADVDVHGRSLPHHAHGHEHDLVDVDSKAKVDIEARGGDALLLGSVVSNSVKNFGRVVDNALEGKSKRDLLGLGHGKHDDDDKLLDLDLNGTLDLTGDHGILGGILRARAGSLMARSPSLLKSLGFGKNKGGASKAKSTSASGGILGISRLLGGKAL